ncbi:general substrate transporter [Thozetella sp. PMI_491]|nr:general substrate transporter [Thozetella sp. PMI_491]
MSDPEKNAFTPALNDIKAEDHAVVTGKIETVIVNNEHLGHLANFEDHQLTKLEAAKKHPWQVVWCLYAAWIVILASFEGLAGGNVIGIPQFRKDFGKPFNGDYVLDGNWQSAINGGPNASVAIGSLITAYWADVFGRKWLLMFGCLIGYAGITLEITANTIAMFFAGKLINGFAIGLYLNLSVTLLGEFAPLALRGVMVSLSAVSYSIGPLLATIIMNFTSSKDDQWAYRAIFASQYGFLAIVTIFWFFLPESPWWLMTKNKEEQAQRSLRKLGVSEEEMPKRMAYIRLTLAKIRNETEGVTYLECFRASNLRRTIITVAPLTIQALCGIGFIGSYFTYYVQLAGYETQESFHITIGQQILSLTGSCTSLFLIDRMGRRSLTFWSLVGLTILLMLAGGLGTQTENPAAVKGVIAFELLYTLWYNASIAATAYTLLAETATTRLRGKSIALGVALQNAVFTMWSFVLPYIFNPDQANLGAKTAFIFGGISVLCMLYIWFYQPETAGRSFEELDELFMKRVPARQFKGYKTDAESQSELVRQQQALN